MATSGPDFTMGEFLGAIADTVRPSVTRPVVLHADELEPLPANQVHNPSFLAVAGRLPTTTFEIFRQTIPRRVQLGHAAPPPRDRALRDRRARAQRDRRGGRRADTTVAWSTGDLVYTPPWAWHRHYNDSADDPVEFLTIENSRLLGLLGVGRRQSAGLATMDEARARFKEEMA